MVLLRGLRVRMGVATGISEGRKVSCLPTNPQHMHDIALLASMAHPSWLVEPHDTSMCTTIASYAHAHHLQTLPTMSGYHFDQLCQMIGQSTK